MEPEYTYAVKLGGGGLPGLPWYVTPHPSMLNFNGCKKAKTATAKFPKLYCFKTTGQVPLSKARRAGTAPSAR